MQIFCCCCLSLRILFHAEEKKFGIVRVADICPKDPEREYSQQQILFEYSYLENSKPGDSKVVLKPGAQVMCTVNIEDAAEGYGVCNGSQGKVLRFSEQGLPVVKFNGIPIPITLREFLVSQFNKINVVVSCFRCSGA